MGEWRVEVAERYLVGPIMNDIAEDPNVPDDCPGGKIGAVVQEEPLEEVPVEQVEGAATEEVKQPDVQ